MILPFFKPAPDSAKTAEPGVITLAQRIFGTTRGLILQWRDQSQLLFEVYTFGAPPNQCERTATREQNFIRMMRGFERAYTATETHAARVEGRVYVPAINDGFTDRDYGEVYEAVCLYVKGVADKGAKWRLRKDSRG